MLVDEWGPVEKDIKDQGEEEATTTGRYILNEPSLPAQPLSLILSKVKKSRFVF